MIRIWLWCCLIVGACAPTERPTLLEEEADAQLLEVQSALSSEEQARLDKIANRTLLQKVVDEAPVVQLQSLDFACSAQRGGVVTYVQKQERLRGLRLSIAEEQSGRSTRWYYQREAPAVLVAHEQSAWQGNQEQLEQTVFYLDGADFLQILYRQVNSHPERLEKTLQDTPFRAVELAAVQELWTQLQVEEEQLLLQKEAQNYSAYFCR